MALWVTLAGIGTITTAVVSDVAWVTLIVTLQFVLVLVLGCVLAMRFRLVQPLDEPPTATPLILRVALFVPLHGAFVYGMLHVVDWLYVDVFAVEWLVAR